MEYRQPNPLVRQVEDLTPLHREHYEVARSLKGWFRPAQFANRFRSMFPKRAAGSILPSDYCFNRHNKGNPQHPRFFLWDNDRSYRFIGLRGERG